MTAATNITIAMFTPAEATAHVKALGALLHACVEAGASVNFVLPFTLEDSIGFWRRKVLPAVEDGGKVLFVASDGDKVVGSVQLDIDTPPNQPHRAEVSKLLVHPGWRRRGIARALMAELERHATALGRTLITLDTRTGDMAEPLYASMGYETAGVIPGYCRDTIEDRLDPTTIMFKWLSKQVATSGHI